MERKSRQNNNDTTCTTCDQGYQFNDTTDTCYYNIACGSSGWNGDSCSTQWSGCCTSSGCLADDPKATTLSSPADGTYTNDNTPTFSWNEADDPGCSGLNHYQIQVDDNSDFSSPEVDESTGTSTSYTPSSSLPDGKYYWRVAVVSNAGNVAWSSSRTITIDTTSPTASISLNETGCISHTTVNVSWSGEDTNMDKIEVYKNDALWTTTTCTSSSCSGSQSFTGQDLYEYTFYSISYDKAGNKKQSSSVSYKIDQSPPPTPSKIDANGSCVKGGTTVRINWSSVDDVGCSGTVYYRLNPLTDWISSTYKDISYSSTTTKTFNVSTKDSLENENDTIVASVTVSWDADSPSTPTLSSPSNGAWTNDNTPTLSWNAASDTGCAGLKDYNIQVDDNSDFSSPIVNAYTSSTSYTTDTLNDGIYYWRVRARDNVGNIGGFSDSWKIGIDTVAPSCSISSISESSAYAYVSGTTVWYNNHYTGSFTVTVSASDDRSGVSKVRFPNTVSAGGDDTSSPYSWTYSWDTSDTFSGSATATAYDKASNTKGCSFNVYLDNAAPTTPSLTTKSCYSPHEAWDWSDSSDSGSGFQNYLVHFAKDSGFTQYMDTASRTSSSFSDAILPPGQYYWRVIARDNVDNRAENKTSIKIGYGSACCPSTSHCVYNSQCYSPMSILDSDSDGAVEICKDGTWQDLTFVDLFSQGWKYRSKVTFNGKEDAVIKVIVPKTQYTNDDFSDIRFTYPTPNGEILLDQYLANYNSTHATFYVHVPNSTSQIYIYYGNPSATLSNTTQALHRIAEYGYVTANHEWTWVSFNQQFKTIPVVIASPMTYAGSNQGVVRIKGLNESGFYVAFEEYPSLDGSHAYENISYIAILPGVWQFGDSKLEAGFCFSNYQYSTCNFQSSFSNPAILTQLISYDEYDRASHIRAKSPTSTNISVKVEEEKDTAHVYETIGYIVVESGSSSFAGSILQAGTATASSSWATISYPQSFPENPIVVAKFMTENGGDNGAERMKSVNSTSFQIFFEESPSFDGSHTTETLGWLALDANELLASDTISTTADTDLPNVTLVKPQNDTKSSSSTITFECYANDSSNLVNLTLWIWGPENKNYTVACGSPDCDLTQEVTLSDGNYEWNCQAFDEAGNEGWAPSNYTLLVDTIPPQISFVSPTPENNTYTFKNIQLNLSVSDANLKEVKLEINNVNITLYGPDQVLNLPFDEIKDESYYNVKQCNSRN